MSNSTLPTTSVQVWWSSLNPCGMIASFANVLENTRHLNNIKQGLNSTLLVINIRLWSMWYWEVEIKKMLKKGVIERIETECVTPIGFALTKNQSLHSWIDYSKLIAISTGDPHSLLIIEQRMDSLRDALIFSTLDKNHGFWQAEINDANCDNTAVTLHHAR